MEQSEGRETAVSSESRDRPDPLSSSASSPRGAGRLALLGSLYVAQAIPLGFFIEAVPAIGRDLGLSLRDIGLIQVLALPFLIKFLWAPLVDGLGSEQRGHYRSWLLPLQCVAVATVVGIAWLDPASQSGLLFPLAGLFLFLAATQDIASDGLAVRILQRSERGIGNGVQVGGYYLGQILGGGLTLALFARFGWRPAILAMAAFMALPFLQLLSFSEPERVDRGQRTRVDFGALARFFRRPGAAAWVGILVLYRAGDGMALTMARPLFVDLGLSLAEIGAIVGLGSSLAALAGALAGGYAVERVGRRPALAGFALLHGLALASFALPASGRAGLSVIWGVSVFAAFAGGMATAALYTCMMDRSAAVTGGTDFTLQQSLAAAGPLVGAALSGLSAQALGFPVHFVLCAAPGLLAAGLVVARLREPSRS